MPKAQAFQLQPDGSTYKPCAAADATHLYFEPPFGVERRLLPVLHGNTKRAGTNCWSWNGDLERPTLRPSILNDFRPHDKLVDHVWITDGKVQYLPDCSHAAAGQTHDLNELSDS